MIKHIYYTQHYTNFRFYAIFIYYTSWPTWLHSRNKIIEVTILDNYPIWSSELK